ncbi:MAG: DUF5916 domain-containing protein [bacterium]
MRRNSTGPVLDGILSKKEWTDAALVTNFTQKEPQEGRPASEATVVLITYDEKNIYFGIRCFDKQPYKIVANEMRRDHDLSDNDYFEIIIDTYHDQRNAYYFATNSLGARLDSEIKSEGTHINRDWDGVWRSASRRDKYGWTAEIAIPFKTLRFKNKENLTWGINFGRYIPRKREEDYWAPISRDDDFDFSGKFRVSKFGVIRGLKNIKHDSRVQLKPYTIAGIEKTSAINNTKKITDAGLDAKVHITSGIVSDLTVNTDFAQVESDQEQVNLSRFDLFFPEKREFFLEGLDIFNIGEGDFSDPQTLLFYSRNIGLSQDPETLEFKQVQILSGAKITGKEGPFEIGFLDAYTDGLNYTNAFNTAVRIPETNYSALRIKKDVLQRSYVGVIALSKDPVQGGQYNRTFGIDGLFAFDNNLSVKGYFAKTLTPGLKGKDYNGLLDVSWGNDKFSTRGSYTDIGENFNPEMGFLLWHDIRRYKGNFTLSPRPHFANLRQVFFSNDVEVITNHDNELQYRTLSTSLFNMFQDESYLYFGFINFYDNVPAPGFDLGTTFIPAGIYKYNIFGFSYYSDRSRKLSGSVDVLSGSFYDGTFNSVTLSTYLRPTKRFGLDVFWDWNRVDVPFPNGEFTTSILGGRVRYSFTPNLFAKAYVQWNELENRVVSNFLMNFIHTPGSDFFLVYNEERDTTGARDPVRTVLAKVTYLLNF